jgi:hypothetical protein
MKGEGKKNDRQGKGDGWGLCGVLCRVSDLRMVNKCRHRLLDIVFIAIWATIAQADDWEAMVTFAQRKAGWLRHWIELSNGIPSLDTIERVFSLLDAEAFERCLLDKGQVTVLPGFNTVGL